MSTDRIVDDYLADILEAISDIRSFTEGLDYDAFRKDRKTSNAVIRSLEVIGEAVKNIPVEVRQLSPELPWKEIAGTREELIHEYFGVDLQIVWETIQSDLGLLEQAILTISKVKGRGA